MFRLLFILVFLSVGFIPVSNARHVFLYGNHVRKNGALASGDLLVREVYRQAFLKMCRSYYGSWTHDEVLEGELPGNLDGPCRQFDLRFSLIREDEWEVELLVLKEDAWESLSRLSFNVCERSSTLSYVKQASHAERVATEVWLPAIAPYLESRRTPDQSEMLSTSPIDPPYSFIRLFYALRDEHMLEIEGHSVNTKQISLLYSHLYQETLHQGQGGAVSYLARALLYAGPSLMDTELSKSDYQILALLGFHDLALQVDASSIPDSTYEAYLKFDWDRLKAGGPIGRYLLALIAKRHSESAFTNEAVLQAVQENPVSSRIVDRLYTRLGRKRSHAYYCLDELLNRRLPQDPVLQKLFEGYRLEASDGKFCTEPAAIPISVRLMSVVFGVDLFEHREERVNSSSPHYRPFIPQAEIDAYCQDLAWDDVTAGEPSYVVLAKQITEQRTDLLSYYDIDQKTFYDDPVSSSFYLKELESLRLHPEYPVLVSCLPQDTGDPLLEGWDPKAVGFYDVTSKFRYGKSGIKQLFLGDRVGCEMVPVDQFWRLGKQSRIVNYYESEGMADVLFDLNPYDPWAVQQLLSGSRDWEKFWDRLSEEQKNRVDYRALVANKRFYALDYAGAEADLAAIVATAGDKLPFRAASLQLDVALQNESDASYLRALDFFLEHYAKGLTVGFTKLKKAEVYWSMGEYEKACSLAEEGASSWARFALIYSSMIHLMCGDTAGALEYQRRNYRNYGIELDLADFQTMSGLLTDSVLETFNVSEEELQSAYAYRQPRGLILARDWDAVSDYYSKNKKERMPSDFFLLVLSDAAKNGGVLDRELIQVGLSHSAKRQDLGKGFHPELKLLETLDRIDSESLESSEAISRLHETVDSIYLRERCKIATLAGLYCEVMGEGAAALDFYRQAARPRACDLRFVPIAFARLVEAGVLLPDHVTDTDRGQ